jgi:hypothetical protein
MSTLGMVKAMERGDGVAFVELFKSVINTKVTEVFEEIKKDIANDIVEELDGDEDVEEARIKRVNRIRGGVVQRRKVVSNVGGYRVQGKKLVRMSASERRNRQIAQRKAARKRRGKIARSLIKRAKTNRQRNTRGFNR